jgi:hypothetical protein
MAIVLSFGFEQEVAAGNALLRGLSSSPALKAGDAKGFYDRLKATTLCCSASLASDMALPTSLTRSSPWMTIASAVPLGQSDAPPLGWRRVGQPVGVKGAGSG